MKKKLIILLLILFSLLTVFSESSNFYWYRTSDGSRTKVDVFRPLEEGKVNLVVVGESGLFTSNDGLNWIKRTVGYEVDGTFYNARHLKTVSGNDDGFTTGGDWGVAGRAYSSDGITWESNRLDNADMHDIIWSEEKGIYVAVSGNDEWGQGSIRSSSDGKEWTDERLENGYYPGYAANGVAYGNGVFVAVGEDRIFTSTTGSSWKQSSGITFGYSDIPKAITHGNGKFVVAGEEAIYYIEDTKDPKNISNWEEAISVSKPLSDVIWNGSIFIAVGYKHGNSAPIYISNDGMNWDYADISTTETFFRSVTWSSELNAFFAVSKNPSSGARGRIFKSDANGANWKDLTDQIVIKDESGERVFENDIASIKLETIYAKSQFVEEAVEDESSGLNWLVFTKTGYRFQNSNLIIDGDLAVLQTDTMTYGTGNKKTTVKGDIYVNEYTNNQKDDFDAHCDGDVIEKSFTAPECWGTYNSEEDYKNDFNNKKDELDLGNGTISGNVFLLLDGEITIKGNFTINGALFFPNASKVTIQNNPDIKGGICAPEATLYIKGSATIFNKVFVHFLDIKGNTSIRP